MSSNRRQSGLWTRNADTGFYEQAPIPSAHIQPKGPYAYYEPPPRQSYLPQSRRSSFSERVGKPGDDESTQPTANGLTTSAWHKEPRTAAAEKIGRRIADTGLDLAGSSQRPGRKYQDLVDTAHGLSDIHPETTSARLAETKHINSTSLPGSVTPSQSPMQVDPDHVPSNLRATAWSPDPQYPRRKSRQASNPLGIADPSRRDPVPGQSPLQSLESWSKDEKRAKVEQAEQRAQQRSLASGKGENDLRRSATLRSERGRVVSDGVARRSSQPERQVGRRQVSDPAPKNTLSAAERFQNASNAMKANGRRDEDSVRQTHLAENSRPKDLPSENVPSTEPVPRGSADLGRSQSGKYKHRARDAGFAGAAAAYSAGQPTSTYDGSAERGKAAYERRKASLQTGQSPVSPTLNDGDKAGFGMDRRGSRRLQKRAPLSGDHSERNLAQPHLTEKQDQGAALKHQESDSTARNWEQSPAASDFRHEAPIQTGSTNQASQRVGFHPEPDSSAKHHRIVDMLHHTNHKGYIPSAKPLEDWRKAKTARLTSDDLEFEQLVAAAAAGQAGSDSAAWWEKSRRSNTKSSKAVPNLPHFEAPYEEQAQRFEPYLYLRCGPLLRYTGIKRESSASNTSSPNEVWRGSVMIVTDDDQSDLARTPVLRLFAQPMDLLASPPHVLEPGHESPQHLEDPVAGQVKLSRTGRPVYVRPVSDIGADMDLSQVENKSGLFSAAVTRTPEPQAANAGDRREAQHISSQNRSRVKARDGEQAGRYRDVKAARLHTERGVTYWRFNIEIELGKSQYRVAYRINNGPAIGFWLPAKGETMNILFHSCNGFSLAVDSKTFCGPDPLWRDVLNRHQTRPFHVMIGGGDQIYNDAATRDTVLFKEWSASKNPEHKRNADFSPEMQDELEGFYSERYARWFSQGLFGMANSQIPMINIWDDHDIIDGFGSYPHHFMSTPVFTGLGAVAFKYYMLYQHQSLSTETETEEPSWLLGKTPGPYIHERGRNLFMSLGNKVAFLGMDCRTERMRDEVLSAETYNNILDRCQDEIVKGQTKHLIVLLGVPIAYPRLNFLENVLTSRAMAPIKALGRTGMLGGFVNKFDGGVEILDDLDDHWTAKHHKGERNWFVEELQELAAEKSIRVTILGGDVHLGAVGQFYSPKKLGIPKDRDHRYMPNLISSAIVNTPPPTAMADVLNRRNKVHHLNTETDEDMIPMFSHDVDGSKRNNNHLMPRRNYAIIREYLPGSTPPSTPVREGMESGTPVSEEYADSQDDRPSRDRRFPPGSMKRTMSLTRGPVNLMRRLSGSSRSRIPPVSLAPEHIVPYTEESKAVPRRANSLSNNGQGRYRGEFAERPVYTFHRRPTDLSEKEAPKVPAAATDDSREAGHINLEGGLDISLCMEVNQHDPSGTTVPYRLLVPALWYETTEGSNTKAFTTHRNSFMQRLRWNRKRETPRGEEEDDWSGSETSPLRTSQDQVTERNTVANSMGLTETGRGAPGRTGPHNTSGSLGTGPHDATPRAPRHSQDMAPPLSTQTHSRSYSLHSTPAGREPPTPTIQSSYQKPFTYRQSGSQTYGAPPNVSSKAYDESRNMQWDDGHKRQDFVSPAALHGQNSNQWRSQSPDRRTSRTEGFFGIGNTVRDAVAGSGRRSIQAERSEHPATIDNNIRYSVDAGRPTAREVGRKDSLKRGGSWKLWRKRGNDDS